MICLAVMLAMQDAGFGTEGQDLFWNQSPVMNTGTVSPSQGIWVNSLPVSKTADRFTDQVTISFRFRDPLEQARTMTRFLNWLDGDAQHLCNLSCAPRIPEISYKRVDITNVLGAQYDTADNEGRWVTSVAFNIAYALDAPTL